MINITDTFPDAKPSGTQGWYKAVCPECATPGSLAISGESGSYHCKKQSCRHQGRISNGEIKKSAAVIEASHQSAQDRLKENFGKVLERENLVGVWSNIALNPEMAVGYTSTGKLQFGIYYNGDLQHIKNHKGRQFGKASNKIYPEAVLDKGMANTYLWVTEGEKDAITALCHSLQAVTFTSGAGAVPKDVSKMERFKNIVICYDNDTPGRDGAMKVARELNLQFPNINIKIFNWVGKGDGYDLTDFFRDGGTVDQLFLCLDNDGYKFGEDPSDFGGWGEISLADYMQLDIDPVEWICKDIVCTKGLSMIAGTDNTGKSILAMQLAVSVAIGVPFLHFEVPRPRKVLLIQFEMDDGMVQQRVPKILKYYQTNHPDELRANISNLKTVLKSDLGELFNDKWESLRGNLQANRKDQYDLIVVDNLYTSTGKDISKNHEVKDVVAIIRGLIDTFGVSFMVINHNNKPRGDTFTLRKEHIRGGKLLTDNLEFCIQIARAEIDPDEKLRIFKITKSRMASEFTHVACGMKLEGDDGELKFDWLGPLPNKEEIYYLEPKKNKNFEILEELLNISSKEHEVSTIQIEGVLGDHRMTRRSVFRWINRQSELGTIVKKSHGKYKIMKNELWNLLA
tara:strand:- start:376 stop:2253 length:1878 start_codon:yes stop_codon:yes gene_type:complete